MAMLRIELIRVLGYIWAVFGAYWLGFGLVRGGQADSGGRGDRRLRIAILAITFVLLFAGRHAIPPALLIVLGVAWGALGLYWVAPSSAAQSGEFRFYRALRLLVLAVTFALLFWDRTGIGVLGGRFAPESPDLEIAGLVAALCGLALALWARIHLGRHWSDKVQVKVDHRLIRTGPYAFLRHPIYSGVLLGVAGTALVVGEWRGVLAFVILLVNYIIKAKREDRILAGAFADFVDHKRQAGFLLPNFRRRS
jgi:protein-S-isoprenylcysteine O-methyltransferase Ste14